MLTLFNSGSSGREYSLLEATFSYYIVYQEKGAAQSGVLLEIKGLPSSNTVVLGHEQLQRFFDECVRVGLVKVPGSVPASALLIEGSL